MKIISFNIRNRYKIDNYNGLYKNRDIVKNLSDYIKQEKIDIVCMQEVVKSVEERLKDSLPNYDCVGKFRIKNNFIANLKKFKNFNESNSILTKTGILDYKTLRMPHMPDLIPRVVTLLKTDTDIGRLTILNTHLTAYNKISKNRQLKYLYKIIKNISGDIIVTGDFNMNIKSNIMLDFINKLEKLGIVHYGVKGRTFKKSKKNLPIDHIFVSKNLNVNNICIIDNKTLNFSDHHPIMIEII